MGDRANVAIETQPGKYVYIYTHWGGSTLPADVQTALMRRLRWDDPMYLTRIIFGHICPVDDHCGETGFGIGTSIGDNEYPLIRVHPEKGKITVHRFDFAKWEVESKAATEFSFQDFCEISDISWNKLVPA